MIKWLVIVLVGFSLLVKAEIPAVKVTELAPNVYQHVSYMKLKVWGLVPASGLVYVDDKDAYLIDTPWTQKGTEQLLSWTQQQGYKVKAAVVTHFHHDASGGLPYLNRLGVETYALGLTNQLLAEQGREVATHSFNDKRLRLADGKLEVFYPGGGHAQDNVVVWLAEQQVMFGGCFVKSAKSRSLGNLEDAAVMQWANSIENTLTTYPEIKILVPGHGKVGDKGLLEHTKSLIQAELAKGK